MAERPVSRSPAVSRQGSKPPHAGTEAATDLPKLGGDPAGSRKSSKPAALNLSASDTADASLPSADPSPSSPIGRVVRKSVNAAPAVAVVHRVHLREWQEKKGRPPSGGKDDGHLPSVPMVRRASMSAIQLQEERTRRMPSLEVPIGQLEGTTVDVRQLDNKQVARRTRDAADFFRDARAINRSTRTVEEAETLLAEARKRRNSKQKADLDAARKAKEMEFADEETLAEEAEKAAQEKAAQEKKEAEGKPRVLDMAAMWGPKPVAKKEPAKEPVKGVPAFAQRRGRAGSITEGVKVGDGSFLRRLSHRRSTIE